MPLNLCATWLTTVDSNVLFSLQGIKDAVATAKSLGIKTIFPAMWVAGQTLFPSPTMASVGLPSIDSRCSGRNPLKELVVECKLAGIRVIPWFEWGLKVPVTSPLCLIKPNWFLAKQDGSKIFVESGIQCQLLNPIHPEAANFLVNLIKDACNCAQVQGIQLDDHFSIPIEFGYDAHTANTRWIEESKGTPANTQEPSWMLWRANKLSQLYYRIFNAVKQISGSMVVTLAPSPYSTAYGLTLQDWHYWRLNGYVEELYVQLYRDNLSALQAEMEKPEVIAAKNHIPTGIGLLSGFKTQPFTWQAINDQVYQVKINGYQGVSFFFYESLLNYRPAAEDYAFRKTKITEILA